MTGLAVVSALIVLVALAAGVPVTKVGGNIALEDVVFNFYTSSNPSQGTRVTIGDVQSLTASKYDPLLPTKLIMHGWMDALDEPVIQVPKNAFLKREPMNVIGVGWEACSKNILYEEAVQCAKQVGGYAGDLLVWLNQVTGVSPNNMHAIGHSLGAQGCSQISKKIKIGLITGLDPASPLYAHEGPDNILDTSDAVFVDVIHTSIGFLGMEANMGHVDFYPNGGSKQPGCTDAFGGCSHSASYYFYSHTINKANTNDYMSFKCQSVQVARNQSCSGTPLAPMGYGVTSESKGIYYTAIGEIPYY